MTELTILGIFVAFLIVLAIGLAVYEWLNDNNVPDWVKDAQKQVMTRTWYDLVRKHIPDATDEQCEYILWEETAWPCCDAEYAEKQIIEYVSQISGKNK